MMFNRSLMYILGRMNVVQEHIQNLLVEASAGQEKMTSLLPKKVNPNGTGGLFSPTFFQMARSQ